MKKVLLVSCILALLGSEKTPESSTRAGMDFQVDKLFTVEQCTVYRFSDGGGARYFTNCKGETTWTENCGKGCTKEQSISGGY